MQRSHAALAVPAIIGVMAGAYLAYAAEEPALLTAHALTDGGSPVLGDADAPVTVLEWGDYQCTYCFRFHATTLDEIKSEYVEAGLVKVVFKDFPLNGPDSYLAAEATHCAADQGAYWKYHDIVYSSWAGERTGWITHESLAGFAAQAGLDEGAFGQCLKDGRHAQKVAGLKQYGEQIGIGATPSFVIFNGESAVTIRGNQPADAFRAAIDSLLGQASHDQA